MRDSLFTPTAAAQRRPDHFSRPFVGRVEWRRKQSQYRVSSRAPDC